MDSIMKLKTSQNLPRESGIKITNKKIITKVEVSMNKTTNLNGQHEF